MDNSGNTFIQDITLDTYGHVTALTSATHVPVSDGTSVGALILGKFKPQTNIYYSGAFEFTPGLTGTGPQLWHFYWSGNSAPDTGTGVQGTQINGGTWKSLGTIGMSSSVNFGFIVGLFVRIS